MYTVQNENDFRILIERSSWHFWSHPCEYIYIYLCCPEVVDPNVPVNPARLARQVCWQPEEQSTRPKIIHFLCSFWYVNCLQWKKSESRRTPGKWSRLAKIGIRINSESRMGTTLGIALITLCIPGFRLVIRQLKPESSWSVGHNVPNRNAFIYRIGRSMYTKSSSGSVLWSPLLI